MNNEFLKFISDLMEHDKDFTESILTDNIKEYLNVLQNTATKNSDVTDNGKIILKFLQDNSNVSMWKSKDIAEQLGISSRAVAGSLRKLVTDNFVDKVGVNPIVYTLTDKGKNYKID